MGFGTSAGRSLENMGEGSGENRQGGGGNSACSLKAERNPWSFLFGGGAARHACRMGGEALRTSNVSPLILGVKFPPRGSHFSLNATRHAGRRAIPTPRWPGPPRASEQFVHSRSCTALWLFKCDGTCIPTPQRVFRKRAPWKVLSLPGAGVQRVYINAPSKNAPEFSMNTMAKDLPIHFEQPGLWPARRPGRPD